MRYSEFKTPSSITLCLNFAFSGVTVLLSLTVFQQSISDAMPVTSLQIPLLGKCLATCQIRVKYLGNMADLTTIWAFADYYSNQYLCWNEFNFMLTDQEFMSEDHSGLYIFCQQSFCFSHVKWIYFLHSQVLSYSYYLQKHHLLLQYILEL